MTVRAHGKAWTAHAQQAADFALARPEDESTWTPHDRAEYGELLAGVLHAADHYDVARDAEAGTWRIPRQP